ncbi:hypothetical protein F5Y06DRAFT_281864 [Hypoxylon sp. FL0890]|nr:hypothetical protein F5Y06DRAFT_281864 [Hypoxylon sp. FL0890]
MSATLPTGGCQRSRRFLVLSTPLAFSWGFSWVFVVSSLGDGASRSSSTVGSGELELSDGVRMASVMGESESPGSAMIVAICFCC